MNLFYFYFEAIMTARCIAVGHASFNGVVSQAFDGWLCFAMVYFYVRSGISYRDLDEIMAERGVAVEHATLNRWVQNGDVAQINDSSERAQPETDFRRYVQKWGSQVGSFG